MEQGPTEPHAGRSTFLLSSGGAGGGCYGVAVDTAPIPTQNQFPCRTLVACLACTQRVAMPSVVPSTQCPVSNSRMASSPAPHTGTRPCYDGESDHRSLVCERCRGRAGHRSCPFRPKCRQVKGTCVCVPRGLVWGRGRGLLKKPFFFFGSGQPSRTAPGDLFAVADLGQPWRHNTAAPLLIFPLVLSIGDP